MSKKNGLKKKYTNNYPYPLPERAVLYSRKKYLKPVPEVGIMATRLEQIQVAALDAVFEIIVWLKENNYIKKVEE